MIRPSYKHAVEWIAQNDDTEWVEHSPETGPGTLSVTGALVIDLFGVTEEKLRKDLRAELVKSRVKSEPDGAYEGKPIYRGHYYFGGNWETVTNGAGNSIAYETEHAALSGAKHTLTKLFAEAE